MVDNWLPSAFHHVKKSSMDILLNISCCHIGNYFLINDKQIQSLSTFKEVKILKLLGAVLKKVQTYIIHAESVTFAQSQCGLLC